MNKAIRITLDPVVDNIVNGNTRGLKYQFNKIGKREIDP